MAHSKNFEKVKKYYDDGLWTFYRACNAVGKWITEKEYEEITNEVYQPPQEYPHLYV